jgi:hypothetical protein
MICTIYAVLGVYLIIASRNPAQHRSLISFTIWSSAAHAAVMAVQAMGGCSRTFSCFNCAGISKLRRIRRSKIEV